ncbi:MAG: hypothetical protein RL380_1186 [Verrucomicrobiota bacterium]|jgi:hypothetical protein
MFDGGFVLFPTEEDFAITKKGREVEESAVDVFELDFAALKFVEDVFEGGNGFDPLVDRVATEVIALTAQAVESLVHAFKRGAKFFEPREPDADLGEEGGGGFAGVVLAEAVGHGESEKAASRRPSRLASGFLGLGFGRFGFGGDFLAFDVGGAAFTFLNLVELFAHKFLHLGNDCDCEQTMKTRAFHFNIILLAVCLAGGVAGCATMGGRDKEMSSVELYQEVNLDGTTFSQAVAVGRVAPVAVNIESSPFADERDVESVALVEELGGFAVRLALNRHGTMVLENLTRSNPNRRVVVFGDFNEKRWLAAPRLSRPIGNGVLVFTPDASRAEAERFVRGLSNAVVRIQKNSH